MSAAATGCRLCLIASCRKRQLLICLLCPAGSARERTPEKIRRFWNLYAARGSTVVSVCTGALILAAAGMLDGLSATTHHSSLDLLREYGQITIQEGTRFVMHERVATSAGVTAGIDLALALVAREWGHSVAESVAANLEWESTSWKQAPSEEPLQQPTFSISLATMNDSGGILSCLRAAFERYESSYTRGAYEDTVLTPESLQKRLDVDFCRHFRSGGNCRNDCLPHRQP